MQRRPAGGVRASASAALGWLGLRQQTARFNLDDAGGGSARSDLWDSGADGFARAALGTSAGTGRNLYRSKTTLHYWSAAYVTPAERRFSGSSSVVPTSL